MAFHPEDRVVASCSEDWSIKLWNLDDGGMISTMKGHSASVNCVDFSPDGLTIASGSGGIPHDRFTSVRVWDVKTGKQLWQVKVDDEVSSVVYSPDGSKLAAAHWRSVSIFNVETGEVQCTVRGHRYAPSLPKECFLSFG